MSLSYQKKAWLVLSEYRIVYCLSSQIMFCSWSHAKRRLDWHQYQKKAWLGLAWLGLACPGLAWLDWAWLGCMYIRYRNELYNITIKQVLHPLSPSCNPCFIVTWLIFIPYFHAGEHVRKHYTQLTSFYYSVLL